ncbi:MAG TPA: response regulator [Candidatus Nitrosotalea sp.]|nr:response regulator [Candidatus Nitrosotalea sp.]
MPKLRPDGRHRIVVVDDDPAMRELLRTMLNVVPTLRVVAQASNGVEAVAIARILLPDLMTLDLRMPVMDGRQALPLLRDAAPAMRIVVLSAYESVTDLAGTRAPEARVSKSRGILQLPELVVDLLAAPRA